MFGIGAQEILIVFILLLLILGALVAVVRIAGRAGDHNPPPDSGPSETRALDTLKERYARGEVSEEEYRRMRQILEE